jgi:hypothetical protein
MSRARSRPVNGSDPPVDDVQSWGLYAWHVELLARAALGALSKRSTTTMVITIRFMGLPVVISPITPVDFRRSQELPARIVHDHPERTKSLGLDTQLLTFGLVGRDPGIRYVMVAVAA